MQTQRPDTGASLLEKPDWYRIEAKSDEDSEEIIIYDVIGWPYNDAFDLVRALGNITAKNITVRINSPGRGCV